MWVDLDPLCGREVYRCPPEETSSSTADIQKRPALLEHRQEAKVRRNALAIALEPDGYRIRDITLETKFIASWGWLIEIVDETKAAAPTLEKLARLGLSIEPI